MKIYFGINTIEIFKAEKKRNKKKDIDSYHFKHSKLNKNF